jgi:hypothetical protein
MPIPEDILNQIKCCLNDDGHFVQEPILLKCGANACKKCVLYSTNSILKCYSCNLNHEKNDFINSPINKMVESVINLFSTDLFQYLEEKIEYTTGLFFNGLPFFFLLLNI